MEQGKSKEDDKGKAQAFKTFVRPNTEVFFDGGLSRSSVEASVMEVERRAEVVGLKSDQAPSGNRSKTSLGFTRVIPISKEMVWRSFKSLRNKGEKAAGVDQETLASFSKDLRGNLYKIWNRLSSGSYQASAIRSVAIPKGVDQVRQLGLPTFSDRIAQGVITSYLQPRLEAEFDIHSYGYRPGKSAHGALKEVRENVQRYDWVIDLDISNFFDGLSHEHLFKALSVHVEEYWVLLYIGRWLRAPIQDSSNQISVPRRSGTPQGGVISPLLSNLYLHYSLDKWLRKYYPSLEFVRYADDMILHCGTHEEARELLLSIESRLSNCGLELNASKTKIVYCKDRRRKLGEGAEIQFDFLGYRFKPRVVCQKYGQLHLIFDGGISPKSESRINAVFVESHFQRWTWRSIEAIAAHFNAKIRGWLNYFSVFRKGELRRTFRRFHHRLISWAVKRFKRFRKSRVKAGKWLRRLAKRRPELFVHWQYGFANV